MAVVLIAMTATPTAMTIGTRMRAPTIAVAVLDVVSLFIAKIRVMLPSKNNGIMKLVLLPGAESRC